MSSQPGNHCDYSFIPEYHLHRHKMVVALQPLWLLILHVYSFYTPNMVTAQQPLLLLIHRCITSPYTQHGHGHAPMWLISYDWISLPYVQKKNQVYMNIISTQKILSQPGNHCDYSFIHEYLLHQHKMVVALQPLWLLTSHVYSVYSYKMYVAPAIIYMWIPIPYTVITHCIQNTDSQPLCISQPLW